MTTKLLLCVLLFVSLTAFTLVQQSIAGKWSGVMRPDAVHIVPMSYEFTLVEGKLGGTESMPGGDYPIVAGNIKGDSIDFTVDVRGLKVAHKGKIVKDSIFFKFQAHGQSYDVRIGRAK